ncbi:MAG: hypothetical protein R3B13_27705 [Polyangiaceae bacterium]
MIRIATLAIAAVFLGGCAATPPHPGPAKHGIDTRVVELPVAASISEAQEIRVLVDAPELELASILLQAGTEMPAHHSDVPVTILALRGTGAVVVGSERMRLDKSHAVVLARNVTHSVVPDPGTDLVVLVHHLGKGEEHHK